MKEPLAKKKKHNTKAEMKCMLEGCLVKSEECLCLKCSASETFFTLEYAQIVRGCEWLNFPQGWSAVSPLDEIVGKPLGGRMG